MNARYSNAYLLSFFLHGAAIAAVLILAYIANQSVLDHPKVFELVAGAGDNYAATEAPALGVPGGIKAALPAPLPPAPVEAAPPTPAPEPVKLEPVKQPLHHPATSRPKPTPAKTDTIPNFKKTVQWSAIHREKNLERKYAREEAAKERTRESYEQFLREHNLASSSRSARVDAEGLREGVVGGSAANKKGGAGGKALTREEIDEFVAYWAMFRERIKSNHVPPPDVSDKMQVRVEFYLSAGGSISRARVLNSSGNAEFDRSVIEALSRVRMPPPPDKRGDTHELLFKMRDEEG